MYPLSLTVRNLDAALRDLAHATPAVRAAAAADLARQPDEHRSRAMAELTRLLSPEGGDEHAEVRSAAARALTDIIERFLQHDDSTNPACDRETLDALIAAADGDSHVDVRQMALMALGTSGDPYGLAAIERALDDSEPAVRFQAVIAVARVADRARAVAALLAATHDEDPLICHIALRMAEELGTEDDALPVDRAILARAAELLEHDAPSVRVAAAILRARADERDGDAILLRVVRGELSTEHAEDEAAAIEICGSRKLTKARKALERRAFGNLLGIGGDRFAWQARVALARLGHERAAGWILKELRAWTRERRTVAVAAATRARLASARPVIEAMRGDPARADQDAVEEALRALAPHP